tara:strand:+ start:72 stop:497 length:426 start_codon:yes stop_codon:yes gene_type:complete
MTKNYNMTAAQVSVSTGLSLEGVYTANHKGVLKSIKHNSNIFFSEEDVKEWRDNTRVYKLKSKHPAYDIVLPTGGGYANYRTKEINKLLGKHIRLGHWTDFGFAIKLKAYEDKDAGLSMLNLQQTMQNNALECLRVLDSVD